jgi:hypothetical protein
MAGELILKRGTTKTLEANGASIGNNAVGQANDATYGLVADAAYYPDAEFVLGCTFGTSPTEGAPICLLARPINVDGTADTETPEATRPNVFVGNFFPNNVTTLQYMTLIGRCLPLEAEYYLHNNATGQTISAGWTLKVTPQTVAPAA